MAKLAQRSSSIVDGKIEFNSTYFYYRNVENFHNFRPRWRKTTLQTYAWFLLLIGHTTDHTKVLILKKASL